MYSDTKLRFSHRVLGICHETIAYQGQAAYNDVSLLNGPLILALGFCYVFLRAIATPKIQSICR
ncbi:MAG: hypothetical protein F6K16_35025 [Symploca sp. SIO2B6]|nr:hypothetical protein [Symploca sp. SIO2B6]